MIGHALETRLCWRVGIVMSARQMFFVVGTTNLFITTHARLWYESDDFILIKNLEFVALVLYPQKGFGQDFM